MLYDTIEFRQPYKDINDTLYWLVEQAKTGIPYCEATFPKMDNPAEIFYYFKNRVVYENDPPGVELIQSPGTMFENNYHGTPGAGDCDCFVTLLLSYFWSIGHYENFIMLYGRSKKWPSHISFKTVWNGTPYFLDLTEKGFDHERFYPYYQEIATF